MVGRRIRRPRSMLLPYLYPVQLEAIHAQRHRVRPEPGPNTQNKPRELDPKGSHGLLCAHLRQKCRKSVGGPRLSRGTSDGNAGKVSETQDCEHSPAQSATRNAKPWATPICLSERIWHFRVAQGQLTLGHTSVPLSSLGGQ